MPCACCPSEHRLPAASDGTPGDGGLSAFQGMAAYCLASPSLASLHPEEETPPPLTLCSSQHPRPAHRPAAWTRAETSGADSASCVRERGLGRLLEHEGPRRQWVPCGPSIHVTSKETGILRVPQEGLSQGWRLGGGTPRLVRWDHSRTLGHPGVACPQGPTTSASTWDSQGGLHGLGARRPPRERSGLGSPSAGVFPASSGPGHAPETLMEPGPHLDQSASQMFPTCSSD